MHLFLELTKVIGNQEATYPILERYGCVRGDRWFHIKIGESRTMFTSHLDDVAEKEDTVVPKFWGERYMKNANGILGADDKCGVYIMLRMIEAGVPGHYVFFNDEEIGCQGSKEMSLFVKKGDYDRCISFDRKGYTDIITSQMGQMCCSDEFVSALSDELAKNSLFMQGTEGIYTDSSSFMGVIPECTNLSVGYFNQHTKYEYVDLWFLETMADVCTRIEWENLPVIRVPQDTWRVNRWRYNRIFRKTDEEKKEYLRRKYKFEKDWDLINGISFTVDEAMWDIYWCEECGEFNWDGVCKCRWEDYNWWVEDDTTDINLREECLTCEKENCNCDWSKYEDFSIS